ncbi:(2Fe-2S) ferredoxin domain-containing protein [Xanthobacter sp. V2C-8]|uniref:(2Fe-2S) ferredoxin domain-containing protein n=1 Tax=Xanthobacter albus TaxID=3119929 RepID=UPI00372A9BCA
MRHGRGGHGFAGRPAHRHSGERAGHGPTEGGTLLVQAARALYEAARELYGEERRPVEARATQYEPQAPVRICVCTGRGCRMRWDSASLVEDLRRAAARGEAVTVTTCRCLGMCDEGPVVVAAPAEGFAASSGAPAERVFVNVGKRDIQEIIEAAGGRRQ